jgi:hypothetical protein
MKIKCLSLSWYIDSYDKKRNEMQILENEFFATHNQGVTGSSPVGPTLEIRHLSVHSGKCFFVYARFTPCFEGD